jgi:hypothetical protein
MYKSGQWKRGVKENTETDYKKELMLSDTTAK